MSEVSPAHFVDAVLGYQKTAAIKAAIALDLFTTIASENGYLEKIAARLKASPRGIRILCDYLTVHGFLTKNGADYELTPSTATFLTTSSPAWMGSIVEFMAAPEMISLWLDDPVSYVRNGGAKGLGNLEPDNPQWVTFAKAMIPFVAPIAPGVVEEVRRWSTTPKRVLDVAAGHGMFGIQIAAAFPDAEITALDWKGVLTVATENARAAGVESVSKLWSGALLMCSGVRIMIWCF
jgi:Dimerisation domain